jgi:hypothetical protein
MRVKNSQIIELNTGEILSEKKEKISYFNDDGYLLFYRKNYSRIFSDIKIPDSFTDSELGKIYRMQSNIQQTTNLLVKRTNKRHRPMTYNEIVLSTGLRDRAGKEFIRKLITHGIIAKVTIESENKTSIQYYFNPLYFHNGKRLSLSLYNIFKEQIEPHLEKWVKEAFEELSEQTEERENVEC